MQSSNSILLVRVKERFVFNRHLGWCCCTVPVHHGVCSLSTLATSVTLGLRDYKPHNALHTGFCNYLFLPAGGVDASQAGGVQEAAVMETDADEVGRAVGGRADQDPARGQTVVHLGPDTPRTQTTDTIITAL